MLTTLIYRSRLYDHVPFKTIETMVTAANLSNIHKDVTGILLFNGRHFFQLLEGPEISVKTIYQQICADKRHHNIVQLLCDYAPSRRFGKAGMELFDLRKHEQQDVLQAVLDKGTTRYQLTYNDRALQFFRTFVMTAGKDSFYEIPSIENMRFSLENIFSNDSMLPPEADAMFSLQPMIDPLARKIVALEFRKIYSEQPSHIYSASGEERYRQDLMDKKMAFTLASRHNLHDKILTISLMPMTLVNIAGAVDFLLREILTSGLIPEQIVVQFSEQEVISQFNQFADAVKQLKSVGISVAINDFGSGFAGLQLLAQFQPDRIKINRHLITGVHNSGPRQAIIHAIIQCCSSLEIQISAEGIEVPEEWMWLESAGIEHFQGPLFSKADYQRLPTVTWPEKIYDDAIESGY